MSKNEVTEMVPDFLETLTVSCDDKIAAFQIIPKFLKWLRRNHHLVLRPEHVKCYHKWEILDKNNNTELHWWDNRPVQRLVIVQRCHQCGKIQKDKI
jgi:hypothetical protein